MTLETYTKDHLYFIIYFTHLNELLYLILTRILHGQKFTTYWIVLNNFKVEYCTWYQFYSEVRLDWDPQHSEDLVHFYCDLLWPLSVRRMSSVVRPLTFHILINSSEAAGPIWTKLWWNGPWMAPFQNCVRWSRLPTKMAAKLKIEKRGGWNFNCSYMARSSLTYIPGFSVKFFFQPIYTDYAN